MSNRIWPRIVGSLTIAAVGCLGVTVYQSRQSVDRLLAAYFGSAVAIGDLRWSAEDQTVHLELAAPTPVEAWLPGLSADGVVFQLSPSVWSAGAARCGVVEVSGLDYTAAPEAINRFGRSIDRPRAVSTEGQLQVSAKQMNWREILQADVQKPVSAGQAWPVNPLREGARNENPRGRAVSMQSFSSLRASGPAEVAAKLPAANSPSDRQHFEQLLAAAEAAAASARQQAADDLRREAARLDACQAEQAGQAVAQAAMWRCVWPLLQTGQLSQRIATVRRSTLTQPTLRGRDLPGFERVNAFDYDVLKLHGSLRQPAFTPVALRIASGPGGYILDCVATSNSPLDDQLAFAGQLRGGGGEQIDFTGSSDGYEMTLSAAGGPQMWVLPLESEGGRPTCLHLSACAGRTTLQTVGTRTEFTCVLQMAESELEIFGVGQHRLPVAIDRVHSCDTSAKIQGVIVDGRVKVLQVDLPFVQEWVTQLTGRCRSARLYECLMESRDAAYIAGVSADLNAGLAVR